MNSTYFYHDKPIFGLDIGFNTIKIMQIDNTDNKRKVEGYGVVTFDESAIKDGVIIEPEKIAKSAYELFDKTVVGEINTRRVVVSIPVARTFNRLVTLPKLSSKELIEAIKLEAEQYIPIPIDQLYIDYHIIGQKDKELELLAVAVPKKIVDSYLDLMNILDIEPMAMETTISAIGRLFVNAEEDDVPTVLIDFGSVSADITVYDKGIVVTGTAPGGGDIFTDLISSELKVTKQEAHVIKTKYGLGLSKKQNEINKALSSVLEQLIKEVRRVIRYYEERSNKNNKIGQLITMGGGANMPGLSEYLTSNLRMPVRMIDPWQNMDFGGLQPPNSIDKSMYVTVAGLALSDSKEIF